MLVVEELLGLGVSVVEPKFVLQVSDVVKVLRSIRCDFGDLDRLDVLPPALDSRIDVVFDVEDNITTLVSSNVCVEPLLKARVEGLLRDFSRHWVQTNRGSVQGADLVSLEILGWVELASLVVFQEFDIPAAQRGAVVPLERFHLFVESLNFLLVFGRCEVDRAVLNVAFREFSALVEVLVTRLVERVDLRVLANEVVEIEGDLELSAAENRASDQNHVDGEENDASDL